MWSYILAVYLFRCAANKEIWHLEAIRRAVIFDVDFMINGGHDLYISAVCRHTRIFVCRSAINVTFCEY